MKSTAHYSNWSRLVSAAWLLLAAGYTMAIAAKPVLIEAEAFSDHGGWKPDTQFIDILGSSYLLAHGLGSAVADATTEVMVEEGGKYAVYVRTKDWVAEWDAPGTPGKFEIHVNGVIAGTFGDRGKDWFWQKGGDLELPKGVTRIALRDLMGFDGRCDAIALMPVGMPAPPNDPAALMAFRRSMLGLPETVPAAGEYDLVVVGGGYSGMGAAISAARQGLKVALIQNRPVLGGNGSSEIRVWAQGGTMRGLYPHLGEMIEEFADRARDSPAPEAEFGDALKEQVIRAEKNIDLFLNHHAVRVEMSAANKIAAVIAVDILTTGEKRFPGKFFVDGTGHGTVGALASAEYQMAEEGHLGMSNMWFWSLKDGPQPWPETPWALPLGLDDFPRQQKSRGPYAPVMKGEWFWEGGFDQHPIDDLERIRDWNLRAVFGAFSALKKGPEAAEHENASLDWVAYVGGNRESRRLTGDIVLTGDDIVNGVGYPDGCVPTTWDLDLHYPKEQFAKKFPENPFISRAVFGKGVDRRKGYPVPYRCFYSRNIENLFMAGRCISVTREALGTTRVMRTCGMMGEVVGKAAYVCVSENTTPRGVYEDHLQKLIELMKVPGAARRASMKDPLVVPADAKVPGSHRADVDPGSLPGIVIDDPQAELVGKWEWSGNLKPHVGEFYIYAGAGEEAEAHFALSVPKTGTYDVRIAWQTHENRSTKTVVTVRHADGTLSTTVNQRQSPNAELPFHSLGKFLLKAGEAGALTVSSNGADGVVSVDAVQLIPVP
ncbi:MAG: FAD-dependent oxidoreductase [Verrucomicrobiales bacterium]